jgi:hypothetical protein
MSIGRLIGRVLLVPFGLLLAALAALFVLVTLGQERIVLALSSAASERAVLDVGGLLLKLLFVLISGQVWLLPLIVAVAGEIGRVRSAVFYTAAGGIILALIPLLARVSPVGGGLPGGAVFAIFATAGFAGGFVYWMIAGRRAGPDRQPI